MNAMVRLVMGVGVVIGVIGLSIGLWPHTMATGWDCGTAWSPNRLNGIAGPLTRIGCEEALGNPTVAAVLAILGLVIVVLAVLTGAHAQETSG